MARSVNKVILVGNLTRDPELKYTPQGHGVCTFGIATNREWVSNGEKQEAADFHNIVAWNKLAELCSQLLSKGDKVFVEGRLQTRTWQSEDGKKNYRTEIVIDEMVILSGKGGNDMNKDSKPTTGEESQLENVNFGEEVSAEEIPF